MKRTRARWLLCWIALSLASSARSEESPAPGGARGERRGGLLDSAKPSRDDPPGPLELLTRSTGAHPDDSLPPWKVKGLLLDKPRIAEETAGRMVGLRELDNPHIAPGLLLRSIQEDPNRSRVDLEELRRQRIRMVERTHRSTGDSDSPPSAEPPARPETSTRSRPPGRSANPHADEGAFPWTVFLSSLAAVGLCAFLFRVTR